jgi:hypothetical protein
LVKTPIKDSKCVERREQIVYSYIYGKKSYRGRKEKEDAFKKDPEKAGDKG